jgi:tetratricopeptide (TPR) repeat protein
MVARMSAGGDDQAVTDQRAAIALLVGDLHWQIDQLARRGIKDSAGNPYNPSYFKRGLQKAIEAGGASVPEYVRRYVYKSPSDGYRRLEDADSLDLACEALVADASKPYAHLFTEADREAARTRLAPHIQAIDARKAASRQRIDARDAELPDDVERLQALAAQSTEPEDAVAINRAILRRDAYDVVALNRLGRAYEALGSSDQAIEAFRDVLALDPGNEIATRRLQSLEHRSEGEERRTRQRST